MNKIDTVFANENKSFLLSTRQLDQDKHIKFSSQSINLGSKGEI